MNRRDFLKSAAAVSLAGATSVQGGCAALSRVGESSVAGVDLEQFLSNLDNGMTVIARGGMFAPGELEARDLSDDELKQLRDSDERARKGLRTIFFVGTFADLPRALQLDTEVQHRLYKYLPEFDEALRDTEAYLRELDGPRLERIEATLRHDPDVILRIAETLDEQANAAGISDKRRVQLRRIMTLLSSRMNLQSPALVIDEYLGKVQRLRERHRPDAEHRRELSARVTEAQLREADQGAAASPWYQAQGRHTHANVSASDVQSSGRDVEIRRLGRRAGVTLAREWSRRNPVAPFEYDDSDPTFALVMLGLGILFTALGFGIGTVDTMGLLVVGTVGVIMILIGFIAAIIEAVW